MAEENQNNSAANGAQGNQPQVQFSLQRIYVKDLSFESPKAPAVFQSQWNPQVNLDLNTRHNQLQDGIFEVVLSLSATVTNGDNNETTFIAEVQQAGIFAISGLDEAAMRHTLGAFCPNILFPYAREAIDNLVLRGSFPPLMLSPVNFDALFAQAEQRRQAEEQANA
ncbi:protein-export chaperone SecB [Halopseudomonas phragmitis]|uniref:Protein-export protein SecB n=2 Tax=Pseudomonadaceae TaxID=135621 RepID=A0A1V0B3D7_9GAMM|nr:MULTISPECIES: protein-export chaperone SecB [Pseudomonadaceae]AQZ94415.1 protein-export chaperone SecB [Halopseudomonas phragmitis]RHW21366.1 protein-export chaperone SecB [Pseudomonas jilinensis]